MKLRLLIATILVLFSVAIVGCDDKEDKSNEKVVFVGVKDLLHTDCKTTTKGVSGEKEYLKLKAEGKYLAIKHINAVFNCCPGELLVTSKVRNNTIFIKETEKEAGCKCICPYDLNYKVGALEYGKYHVILSHIDPETILIEFDINFNSGTSEIVDIVKK